jgi:hypothetical protein
MSDHSGQQIVILTTTAKVRERLAVSKKTAHRIHMENINLKKLKEVRRRIVLNAQMRSQLLKT